MIWFAAPLPASEASIAGSYAVSGVNRDGSTYEGELEITDLGRNLYWFEWNDDDDAYTGKGARVGSTLSVIWGSAAARCFAVDFLVTADGSLDGLWFSATDRNSQISQTTAAPTDESGDLEGRYLTVPVEPGVPSLPPRLSVEPFGDGYYGFRWEGGDKPLAGTGHLEYDQIQVLASVAGHEGQCGKSEIEVEEDGSLDGTWIINDRDYRQLGREKAVRR